MQGKKKKQTTYESEVLVFFFFGDKFSTLKKFCKIFSEPESHPNNRESTPPTDNSQENTTNTCEDRNKLAVDKL